MNFLHKRECYQTGDIVVFDCDTQCNFIILTDSNFAAYKKSAACHYDGGHFENFPAQIEIPSTGWWNVVIDLGGGDGIIRHDNLTVIKAAR